MTAKIIPFDAARIRRPSDGESLRFGIEPNGDMSIQLIREDGIKMPTYLVPDARVDQLLASLAATRGRLKWERFYAEHPDRRPRVTKHRGICRARRDGGRGAVGGCRRNASHKGKCRDEQGEYTPATCSHIGMGRTRITIAETGETWLNCARCNARV